MNPHQSHPTTPHCRVGAAITGIALALAALSVCPGCYDGRAIVERVRTTALRNRLEEIDLGTFRTTMPRDAKTNAFTEIELHIFGTVQRYQVQSIQTQLGDDDYRLRHEALIAIRDATPEELAEPDLTELRTRLEQVVNQILDDAPIKSIGFYDMRINYQ